MQISYQKLCGRGGLATTLAFEVLRLCVVRLRWVTLPPPLAPLFCVCAGPPPKRRIRLPKPAQQERGVSLWTLIKDMVGKDLTRVCLPVYFNEPLSALQVSLCGGGDGVDEEASVGREEGAGFGQVARSARLV